MPISIQADPARPVDGDPVAGGGADRGGAGGGGPLQEGGAGQPLPHIPPHWRALAS